MKIEIKILTPLRLTKLFIAASRWLLKYADVLNDLNVYPVPDGDTGTNMSMTLQSVENALIGLQTEPKMEELVDIISEAVLLGARGNSGTILSQIIQGFLDEVRDTEEITIPKAARAFVSAKERAYMAVSQPVEGTILTVIRKVSEAAIAYEGPKDNFIPFLVHLKNAAAEAVDDTPNLLPKLKEAGVYGLSVPFGTNDLMATRFLNFYVRSGGGSLLTKDLKADLTSQLAQDGIKYWVKMYKEISPQDSLNFNVLQQATLFYQGKTAFDFNSGFHIGGINANSPQLIDSIDAYPIPKIKECDKDQGIETSNIPMVVWKNSKHPEVAKAFLESLYNEEDYVKFLDSTPVGMLPTIKGISDSAAYKENETRKKFKHAEEVITEAVKKGTAIGYENGPSVQAGMLTNQHIIEQMFQDIISNGTDPMKAAKEAEKQLNDLFEAVQ